MKKMMTLCAACKKELKMASGAAIEPALASLVQIEEVVTSHGICYECGVTLYGTEIMAKVDAEFSNFKKSEGCLQLPDRFGILQRTKPTGDSGLS